MSVFRVLIKNLIKENRNITFMENEKNCQNVNYFFLLTYKNFL